MKTVLAASAGASLLRSGRMLAQDPAPTNAAGKIYLHPAKGSDTSSGAKDSPLNTLAAAAKRVSEGTGADAITIILSEGVYAVGETAVFKPTRRSFTKENRLTIRAEVLPDDPEWDPGRMPTLIHTMPLSPDWNGRPDPFGGVAYGMMIETSHVTIQGLKILGMPVVEHPKQGAIHRVYPIGRNGRDLDDLEINQCLFAGDEVTNPNHLGILANGSGIVVDHCIFYHLKQPIVYWSGASKGHAMRNTLVYGAYGCGIWTSGIANDFDYRNNIVADSFYIWISQGARSARAEAGQAGSGPGGDSRESIHYKVIDSLFTGNKNFTGSGGGPALNFKSTDPSFLELIGTKKSDEPLELEMDQSKRNYLHPKEGTDAAKIGAGLFINKL
ncbi:MAG: hypothetical protein ACLQU3_11105 [Limisphaerales bacterium]